MFCHFQNNIFLHDIIFRIYNIAETVRGYKKKTLRGNFSDEDMNVPVNLVVEKGYSHKQDSCFLILKNPPK